VVEFKQDVVFPIQTKGFMAYNTQANWNVVRIIYGNGDASESMVDKKEFVFFNRINPRTYTQNNISS
jgi:hypothetical protein